MTRYACLMLLVLFVSGCASQWYVGEWEVTGARFPGISAMGVDEAEAWFGARAFYAEERVAFRGTTCGAPAFRVESVDEDAFRSLYRASFAALELEGDAVEVLRVGCPSEWASPAAMLIKVDGGSGYLVWDGVFFEVDRVSP
ncbi:hypothetical protein [Algiphilus sp.]|uniref:hypothetical protein n=1 Tax=Algiphilus sp. TaxID=1872431 RepID=UPI0025C0D75C|nr:hypothetical protein [Algiphilus sp.]MCK5771481.1 hypothetical protein [Algiphilus sp.]